jgi:hypothetical protein
VTPLFLLLQAMTVTVGDTVRVERLLGALGPVVVRPQAWSLGALGQQLGPAEVLPGPEGSVVRYHLVLWYPGDHLLTMPGPVVVRRDGRSDTLAASTTRVLVASVLPEGERRATLPPRPASRALPLESRSPLPVLILLGLVSLALIPVALRWRRRGRVPQRPPAAPTRPGPEIITRWSAAGEHHAAIDAWGWILARRLAASRSLEETAELQRLLDEMAFSAFAPRSAEALAELAGRAARLGAP